MEDLAARYYRAAYGDERRPQNRAIVTREELEERRRAAWEAAQPITVETPSDPGESTPHHSA